MSDFFSENVLKEIKKTESEVLKKKNFLAVNEIKELLEYLRSMKNKSVGKSKLVDREESTKIFFDFNQSDFLKKIKIKIEEHIGKFFVNDFQPHIITTRYPLRLHVDTGKNPNDVIYKNVVVPLEITYDLKKDFHKPPNTVIFKNRWYNRSALLTKQTSNNYDFIIKDINNKFVDIINILDFKEKIQNVSNGPFSYDGKKFLVNNKFKEYIDGLSKTKRYNARTDKHIVNNKDFNKNDYEKYMSHQPYEDCKSLEIDKVVSWDVGSLITWNRTRIHCSDNFLKNNVISKTGLAFFASKNKI
tara:strand:+ start:19 stop:921 length:903 start_codon:yes stop_codon:yes gene_type:complete